MLKHHLPPSLKSTRRVSAAANWPKAKTKSGSTPAGTSVNGKVERRANDQGVSDRIYRLLKKEQWLKARLLLKRELRQDRDSHWLWMMLGLTYYETFDYDAALPYAKKAVTLQPKCPLALSYYAGTLEMLCRT